MAGLGEGECEALRRAMRTGEPLGSREFSHFLPLTAKAYQLDIPSITSAQFMDLTVLHELAHSFGQDHTEAGAGAFDVKIWSNCLE